jgi:hypothetical protein
VKEKKGLRHNQMLLFVIEKVVEPYANQVVLDNNMHSMIFMKCSKTFHYAEDVACHL